MIKYYFATEFINKNVAYDVKNTPELYRKTKK